MQTSTVTSIFALIITYLSNRIGYIFEKCRANHTIQDIWTIYGKIMIKYLQGHVKIIINEQEFLDIAQH